MAINSGLMIFVPEIKNICSTPTSHPYQSNNSWPPWDPNAMDIDFVKLKKLTPQEHVKCIWEGRYFKCRKIGHNAQNCWTQSQPQQSPCPTIPHSQQVWNMETVTMPPVQNLTSLTSALTKYIQTLGKNKDEVLQILLKLCYKETEEVMVADTFKVLEELDFWNGKLPQHPLPMISPMY